MLGHRARTKNCLRHFALYLSSNFTGDERSENWPRFFDSSRVIFDSPFFRNHGRRSRGPQKIGVADANANCSPHVLSYRYKIERSMAFKIRQKPFSAGALPWTPLGSSWPPSRLGRGHPPYTTLHSAPTHLRRWHASPRIPARSMPIYVRNVATYLNSETNSGSAEDRPMYRLDGPCWYSSIQSPLRKWQ